jgi:uncharacterized protein (TIGR03118 family)
MHRAYHNLNRRFKLKIKSLCAVSMLSLLTACGGGGSSSSTSAPVAATPVGSTPVGSTPVSPPAQNGGYVDTALVSDGVVPAVTIDHNLQNAWGLAFAPGGDFWIADNNNNLSTLYDGNGTVGGLVVNISSGTNGPANPTGQVFNNTSDFVMGSGAAAAPALFIFDGEGGTVTGWNAGTTASILYDDGAVNGAAAAIYKGLALASSNGSNYLYATDFHNAKVDVFNNSFQKVSNSGVFSGKFQDPNIPAGFAPFGITLINSTLYVTYAQQNAGATDVNVGPGLGYVDTFDTSGNLLQRFASGTVLNAPWGVAQAPTTFGPVAGQVLIGNFGDGAINYFSPQGGTSQGALSDTNGRPLAIPGLWALVWGDGAMNGVAGDLYYTAGPNNQTDGVFGRIAYSANGPGSSTPYSTPY